MSNQQQQQQQPQDAPDEESAFEDITRTRTWISAVMPTSPSPSASASPALTTNSPTATATATVPAAPVDDDEMTEVDVDDEGNNSGEYISRLERMIQHNTGGNGNAGAHVFTPEEEEIYEQQRRSQLNVELVRIQRQNFMHFGILCLLPLLMLALVLISSFSQKGTCESVDNYECLLEGRAFMNAFVSRCLCSSVEVLRAAS